MMWVAVTYQDPYQALKANFRAAGLKVYFNLSDTSIAVTPQTDEDGYCCLDGLPDNGRLLILAAERGCARTDIDRSRATVIGGRNGYPLLPYFIPSHPQPGQKHALFLTPRVALKFKATALGEAKIEEYRLMIRDNYAWIVTKNLWEGRVGQLPDHLDCYSRVIWVAWEKSNCFHCHRPHFLRGIASSLCPNASTIQDRFGQD